MSFCSGICRLRRGCLAIDCELNQEIQEIRVQVLRDILLGALIRSYYKLINAPFHSNKLSLTSSISDMPSTGSFLIWLYSWVHL